MNSTVFSIDILRNLNTNTIYFNTTININSVLITFNITLNINRIIIRCSNIFTNVSYYAYFSTDASFRDSDITGDTFLNANISTDTTFLNANISGNISV